MAIFKGGLKFIVAIMKQYKMNPRSKILIHNVAPYNFCQKVFFNFDGQLFPYKSHRFICHSLCRHSI